MKLEYLLIVALCIATMAFFAFNVSSASGGGFKIEAVTAVPIILLVFGATFAIFGSLYKGSVETAKAEAEIRIRETLEAHPGLTYNELYRQVRSTSLMMRLYSSTITVSFSAMVSKDQIRLVGGGYHIQSKGA